MEATAIHRCPPYVVYNIGGVQPENLLGYISIFQEKLVWSGALLSDYDSEGHSELIGMHSSGVPVINVNSSGIEQGYGFTPKIGIREGVRIFAV